jgi:hypothetical protein
MDNLLPERIRQAVASGEFQRALLLWNEYAAQLQQELGCGRLSATDFEEAGQLVAWSRQVALCARVQAQDDLNRLNVAGEYANPPSSHAPRIVQVSL